MGVMVIVVRVIITITAGTANIMPVKVFGGGVSSVVSIRSSLSYLLAVVGVVVCSILLTLAVPRFAASLYALYPEAVFQRFKQSKQTLPIDVYEKSSVDLEKAHNWFETAETWQMQAFFHLLRLNSAQTIAIEKRRQLILQANEAIIQGLRLSPVDPYAWFRLAVVDQMLDVNAKLLIEALRLSIYAGRVEPELLMPRLSLSYRYYNLLDEDMRCLLKGQVRLAWLFRARELVVFAAEHQGVLPWIKDALFFSPGDWKHFSRDLESYMLKN
ncbi:MAG: hypothetical protein ACU837_07335 [Gammaproteobacteria bacterium]